VESGGEYIDDPQALNWAFAFVVSPQWVRAGRWEASRGRGLLVGRHVCGSLGYNYCEIDFLGAYIVGCASQVMDSLLTKSRRETQLLSVFLVCPGATPLMGTVEFRPLFTFLTLGACVFLGPSANVPTAKATIVMPSTRGNNFMRILSAEGCFLSIF
jgi:hypothetical protein